jgi:dihydropteroate synthase
VLPVTGPADVVRRLRAVGAGAEPAGPFAAAAAHGWAEWPEVLAPDVLRRLCWVGLAVAGRDRTLLAGDLRRMGEAVGDVHPRLGAWLRAAGPYAGPPGAPPPLRWGRFRLDFGLKTYVVAIVNRTPDSFSDGRGVVPDVEECVRAAWAAVDAGADIVDVGAESSEERDRGGLPPEVEAERLLPVLAGLRDLPALVSIDCRRGAVARRALEILPVALNDVDALADPELADVAAEAAVPVVLMHSGEVPPGEDPVAVVRRRLQAAVERALRAGVRPEQVVLDAGFGFGTTVEQDLEVTRRLGELRQLGRPLLHAPSRKRTIGRVLAFPETIPERLPGTAAAVAVGIVAGADLVRVHDVAHMARVARMTDALVRGGFWRDLTAP